MEKIKYTLSTLSSLIISPREGQAFYKELDFDDVVTEDGKEINIIYPFYQYGIHDRYDPQQAKYYIPGSSIKGAIRGDKDSVPIRFLSMIFP
jgi:CRISPR/Cas system CSM-associated protein Csm5 (group 7 of RAMP superfamily)